jgi:hypothetical protein
MANKERKPNEQRSDIKNPNNEEFNKDRQNRESQRTEKCKSTRV